MLWVFLDLLLLNSLTDRGDCMVREVMLTTKDNPFDPFDNFDSWYMFDMDKGYNSSAYLDRIARTADSLSDEENMKEIERAIDEIICYDFQDIYRKVVREVSEPSMSSEN